MENDHALSRPSISFPLGLALLVIMLVCMSGFFTCCLHWDKIRSLLQSSSDDNTDIETDIIHAPQKPSSSHLKPKQNKGQSLPVVMPGDQVPKFIAMPCPCEPPLVEKVTIKVQKPPPFRVALD